MDTSKIVHICAEAVLLAGVTFYFNGQVKTLRNEIKDLKAKIEEQQETSNKHLNNLYAVIDQLRRSSPPTPTFQRSVPQDHAPMKLQEQVGLRRRKPEQLSQKEESKSKENFSAGSKSKPNQQPARPSHSSHSGHAHQARDQARAEPTSGALDEELGEELHELEEEETEEEPINSASESKEEEDGEPKSPLKDMLPTTQDLSFIQAAIKPSTKKK